MKTVTIVLDEEVARWAKVGAAQHDTSVSRRLGEVLRKKMEGERACVQSKKRFLQKKPVKLKAEGSPYPKRETLYRR